MYTRTHLRYFENQSVFYNFILNRQRYLHAWGTKVEHTNWFSMCIQSQTKGTFLAFGILC